VAGYGSSARTHQYSIVINESVIDYGKVHQHDWDEAYIGAAENEITITSPSSAGSELREGN
jgi:hypothetical protein